jgi:hypothetical protein
MTNVEDALRLVEEYLRRKYAHKPYELVVMKSLTREEDFGWVFFFNTRQFAETGDMNFALGGNTPLIVDRETGELHVTGTAHPVDHYIEAYRRKWSAC